MRGQVVVLAALIALSGLFDAALPAVCVGIASMVCGQASPRWLRTKRWWRQAVRDGGRTGRCALGPDAELHGNPTRHCDSEVRLSAGDA